jgi:hypothetical protein
VRIALHGAHPALDFVRPLLARNYDLVGAGDSPEALVAFEPVAAVPDSVGLAVFVAVRPPVPLSARTLVIGAAPEVDDGTSHATLATGHPAELLSLIDGFLRYPARFPVSAGQQSVPR